MTQMHMPPQVEQILTKLNDHGYEAFAVGGCVRDMLLGRIPGDWDITTSAMPLQVKALFPRTVDTGIQHGTVTVLMGGDGYEVTTYRIDGEYKDGRHPNQVAFTPDLQEDLRRRDFTINAMAYHHETGIVDIFGGRQDLEQKRICCVGDAMERFEEDALRILRAIRFSAELGFVIESQTWKAIFKIAPNIQKVSKERIQMELTKLLCSDRPQQIEDVFVTGISTYVSPSFQSIPYETITISHNLPSVKYLRWAAFLCQIPPAHAVKVVKSLKLDNDTIAKVKTLATWFSVELVLDEVALRKAMSQMEPEVWDGLLLLKAAKEEFWTLTRQIRERGDCLVLSDLAVGGQDLIAAGISPGKELGNLLNQMLQIVLEHPEWNQKDVLLQKAGLS